jgi:radical SAM protein with 4Fe4S-binding SPASM domain
MTFSLGIGLTNECNLRCPHCYRPDAVVRRLALADVERVCRSLPLRSANLGVGESGLHPEYRAILDTLHARGIRTSITSNGRSLDVLDDNLLRRFHSVELSLDFPRESEHDAFRGRGNWRSVHAALDRCVRLAVPVTVTAVMMSINHDRLPGLARVAAAYGAYLRVNVYQPSRTDRFVVTYPQFWDAWRALADGSRLIGTTEPVLAGVLGLGGFAGPACGRSTVRVAPDGRVLPCTYWPKSSLAVDDLERLAGGIVDTPEFRQARSVPAACEDCPCRGGCSGRRAVLGRPDEPDPYCPFARGDRIGLAWERVEAPELPKLGSACTTVVSAC